MQTLQQTSAQIGSVVYYMVSINGLEFLLRILSPIFDVIRSLGKSWLKRQLTGVAITAPPKHLLYNAATAMDATAGGVSYGQSQQRDTVSISNVGPAPAHVDGRARYGTQGLSSHLGAAEPHCFRDWRGRHWRLWLYQRFSARASRLEPHSLRHCL